MIRHLRTERERDEDTRHGFWVGMMFGLGMVVCGRALLEILASLP